MRTRPSSSVFLLVSLSRYFRRSSARAKTVNAKADTVVLYNLMYYDSPSVHTYSTIAVELLFVSRSWILKRVASRYV